MDDIIKAQIEEQRGTTAHTRRATVPAIEDRLYTLHPVLDQGFVRIIDYMGDDGAIVQAARVSYGKGTKAARNDAGLIRYLMRHRHSTPFEMCEIKFHMKMPIFVARQWIRHRTANVNEYSARYSVLDREFYVPELENMAAQSTINNQGRGDVLGEKRAQEVLELLKADASRSFDLYDSLLVDSADNEPKGLARELARMALPLSTYTQWYWKIDLHNLLHFLALRADPHAQYEIRVYAELMLDMVRDWVPNACAAFEDYRIGNFDLSKSMLGVVKAWVRGEDVSQESSGLSAREWRELCSAMDREA
ncbi:MAG: FAD-dependent thymidylate synthase [Alphaproteobacteria bacterium]